jgi:hypothetical protein
MRWPWQHDEEEAEEAEVPPEDRELLARGAQVTRQSKAALKDAEEARQRFVDSVTSEEEQQRVREIMKARAEARGHHR